MHRIAHLLAEVGTDPLQASHTVGVKLEIVDALPGDALCGTDGRTVWATDLVSAWAGIALVLARRFGVTLSNDDLTDLATERVGLAESSYWRIESTGIITDKKKAL
jgi:hypothetical protein